MGFQYIWPLALLVLLPMIVLLYMMKQKAKERKVSSLYLWREAYQNRRSDTPWEKLKHNLLMYLQLLAMALLILAMTAPYLKGDQEEHSYPILVIDRSASMGMAYDEERTRLEVAQEEAIRYLEGLPREARVTVIAVDDAGTICLAASESRVAAEQAIREIQPTLLEGDVSMGGELYRSLAAIYEDYQILAYTDTPVDFGELNGKWVDVASDRDNVSVDLVSHSGEDTPVVMVKVSNHSPEKDYHGDLSLYLEDELLEVRTIDMGHGTSDIFYFNVESIPVEYQEQWAKGLVLKASLSGKDALEADDQAYDRLQRSAEGKVLLVTEQNTFLEQALRADQRLTVYRTDTAEVNEGYDLYLYDGIFPEILPEDGAVFLINAPVGQYEWLKENGVLTESNPASAGGYLTFGDHEVNQYISGFRTGYRQWHSYELPEWGESYLSDDRGNCVGYVGARPQKMSGSDESGIIGNSDAHQLVAVLGVDLHQGDLPLQSQFPIFISQMTALLLDTQAMNETPLPVFPVKESGVMPWNRTASTVVYVTGGGQMNGDGLTEVLDAGALPGEEHGYPLGDALLILVVVLVLVISGIFLYREKQEGKLRIPVMRLVTVLLILATLLDLTVSGSGRGVTTVYLLDVSESCRTDREEGEQFIREAVAYAGLQSRQEKSAVIAFGGDARVEQFVSEEALFHEVGTSPVQAATNLERAVQTGLALIPEGDAGRMVLLTDGGETEGDVTSLIRSVTGRQLAVQVVSLSGGDAPENYVSQLEVPSDVQIGENFLITVQVESNCSATALLTLYEGSADGSGEKQKAVREVELSPGTNQFVFADTRTMEGLVTYRAVLESSLDSRTVNNQYTAFTRAEAPSRFLILEKEPGESANLQQVLAAAGVLTEVRLASEAPGNLLDMSAYRAIILLDVPVGRMREEFLTNLPGYVQDYGGGLIAIGGKSSFALGGYRDTVLEELLPVDMELKEDLEVPSLSMVYVIDKSGSMGSGIQTGDAYDKLAVAKSAAAEASRNLRAIDRVGVLAFDDQYEWVLPVTSAEEQATVLNAIGSIQSGGGTSIYPAVEAAAKALEGENTKLKHIILLTDGQDGYDYYAPLLERLEEQGITLSTVAVGADADTNLLSSLAEQGEGRYYFSGDLSQLPDIFAQEVCLSMGEYLVNHEFIPEVTHGGELLQGVWEKGLYPLLGYVASTPKDLAAVHLQSDEGDPILSTIQAGLGRTMAWQSDAVGAWNAAYEGTQEYAALWRNMIDWVQTELTDEDGVISVEKEGNQHRITYQTEEYTAETSVHAVCTDADGNRIELELAATAPGVYEAEAELQENQAYSLFLTRREGEEVVAGQMTGVAMQYSREYRFADRSGLDRFLEATGGTEIQTPEQVYEQATPAMLEAGTEEKSLTLPLLLAAVLVFMADIVLQRFGIRPGQILYARISGWWQKHATTRTARTARRQERRSAGDAVVKTQNERADRDEDAAQTEKQAPRRDRRTDKQTEKKTAPASAASDGLLDTSALLRRKEERKRP